ncbi:uncharacterized protein LOC126354801 [Schistocerca gregaria]|uniref:uncharacterized protein LOC126354801 n=1 Tax=Schistocerca gregaria TaxID=7010 RepID=UPI00211EB178|nr:uncharacterized protein LOC126354801 [Schistocerca gregaria]
MCLVDSCCCGLLSLHMGTLLIGWAYLSSSIIICLTEFTNPWVHQLYCIDYNVEWSRAVMILCALMVLACVLLLIAVYEHRPSLATAFLVAAVTKAAANVLLWSRQHPSRPHEAILHAEVVLINCTVLLYSFCVVLSYYMDVTQEQLYYYD